MEYYLVGEVFSVIKADKTVIRETKFIAIIVLLLSVIMQAVFLIIRRWDLSVLFGNLISAIAMIGNFFFMGITVQKALNKDEEDARKLMKSSQSLRNFGVFVFVCLGVIFFNPIASVVPVVFPRIAIALRPMFNKEKDVIKE